MMMSFPMQIENSKLPVMSGVRPSVVTPSNSQMKDSDCGRDSGDNINVIISVVGTHDRTFE